MQASIWVAGDFQGQSPRVLLHTWSVRIATGISWSSLGGLKGVKPPEAFGERWRDWSLGHAGDAGSIPGLIRKVPWRRVWQPTPVFLPREFHGQRNLAGYIP